jgi:CysZ protein
MSNPVSGFHYFFEGAKLLLQPKIRRFVVLPLVLNTMLFVGAIWLSASQFGAASDWLVAHMPDWMQWLSWLLNIIAIVIAALIVFFTFSIMANLVAAPFNGLLAEAVYFKLTGTKPPEQSDETNFWEQILPAFKNELTKLRVFALWSIPCLLLFVIPVVNVAAPFIWFALSAWMLALEYLDYPMGNHAMTFTEQRALLAKHRFLTLGFGSAISLATLIPVANFLVMPSAVAGATKLWVEKLQQHRSEN